MEMPTELIYKDDSGTIEDRSTDLGGLKIQFTAQTANLAEQSGYSLSTHTLEFKEPTKRRMESNTFDLFEQPAKFQRSGGEGESFLSMMNSPINNSINLPIPDSRNELPSMLGNNLSLPPPEQQIAPIPIPTVHSINLNPNDQSSVVETINSDTKMEKDLNAIKNLKQEKEEDNYFELLYQPNEKQRKSYKNENRYILPNPLTIVMSKSKRDKKIKIDKGAVTVSLLYDTGEELEKDKQHILDGVKTRPLDKERKSQFHLKVIETSERNRFRLQFTVKFYVNKVEHVEKIISHCFRVTSNKKCASIERPRPFAIKPNFGFSSTETEVWIRGKMFTDRANTTVTFGGKEARVVETEDNLLVCFAPKRDDLMDDSVVEVKVTNHKADMTESFDSVKALDFTYISDRKRKKLKKDALGQNSEVQQSQNSVNNLFCPPSPSSYQQLDEFVKSESEFIDKLGYLFPGYFPMEAN